MSSSEGSCSGWDAEDENSFSINNVEKKKEKSEGEDFLIESEEHKFFRPLEMTESQFGKLKTSLSGIENLVNVGKELSEEQCAQLKVYVSNLEEFRRTIMQMVELYLDNEEIAKNLFSILDYINNGLILETEFSGSSKSEEEGNILSYYQNSLNKELEFIKQAEEDIQADLEYARLLQLQFEVEALKIDENFEENEEIPESESPLINKTLLSNHLKSLKEGSLTLNPLETPEIQLESNLLQKVFTNTNIDFLTWKSKPLSSIQYIEVKITKKYKSFKEPFVLALWQECDELKLEFSYELLARLAPFSCCLLTHPLQLQGRILVRFLHYIFL